MRHSKRGDKIIMSVLSTLGGAYEGYTQYVLLAVITGAVLINLKTLPGVWHVGERNQPAFRKMFFVRLILC